jgi:hypothetical protein
MAEVTIGEVKFFSDGNSLAMGRVDQLGFTMFLDTEGMEELVDFLTSLVGTEFNRRQASRVPLWESCGLRVQLCVGEKQFSARPANISLTGIFVIFSSDEGPDLRQGANVQVTLEFEGESATLQGIVCRSAECGYGLFFPEATNGDRIDPPKSLSRVVMELQRRWLTRCSL